MTNQSHTTRRVQVFHPFILYHDNETLLSSSPTMASLLFGAVAYVASANLLCNLITQVLSRVAALKAVDDTALSAADDKLPGLDPRQLPEDAMANAEQLFGATEAESTRPSSSVSAIYTSLRSPAPIHSLPAEILSEIFLYYISLSQPSTINVFQDIVASHRIRTTILLVCSRWCATALNDPRLWTTIPLVGSGAYPLSFEAPTDHAAYWDALERRIERTSALPLNLLFHLVTNRVAGDCQYAVSSFQTFVHLFPRANSISINLHSYWRDIVDITPMMYQAEIPLAEHVHTARIYVRDKSFRQKLLVAIPNVEDLVIETMDVEDLVMAAVDIDSWFLEARDAGRCLRSFELLPGTFIRLVQLQNLLNRAPLLETLKISHVTLPTHAHGTLGVVTHSRVSTFVLHASGARPNELIFRHLAFPALRSLTFNWRNRLAHARPTASSWQSLLQSGCHLTELTVLHCEVDDTYLIHLLSYQTQIVTLQLNKLGEPDWDIVTHGEAVPTSILEFLSTKPKDAEVRPLPALKVLRVVVLPHQLKAVKRLVRSRSGERARKAGIVDLVEVDIHTSTTQKESDPNRQAKHTTMFKPFVDAGMKIHISYGTLL